VSITVPPGGNQVVHVEAGVTIFGTASSPPEFVSFDILRVGGATSNLGYDNFRTTVSDQMRLSHEAVFTLAPGIHTFQFRVGASGTAKSLTDLLVTATTVPFSGTGAGPLGAASAPSSKSLENRP
jgi:hypothetical protein